MIGPVARDTQLAARKSVRRGNSERRDSAQRRPGPLQERASVRREWSEHKQQFTAQSKGLKLSLSLSIGVGGLARMLG